MNKAVEIGAVVTLASLALWCVADAILSNPTVHHAVALLAHP